jgi:hypothetical protein
VPIDRDGAREAAEAHFAEERARLPYAPDVVVVEVEEAGGDWRVFYQARAFVETGDSRSALYGNRPLLVSKRTGEVRSDDSGREPWDAIEASDRVDVSDFILAVELERAARTSEPVRDTGGTPEVSFRKLRALREQGLVSEEAYRAAVAKLPRYVRNRRDL